MSDLSIQVRGMGKQYRLPTQNDSGRGMTVNEFWAVRGLEFEVRHGEVVGLVGRNGAGKSTTLKLLSRITEPTEGSAVLYGRLGSLLEVGTGFHPELSGRENVYLNGAILGMSRAEITEKFDEIVEFAGVAKFLDMPVKRYSSGMYVRLAFAVAANLDTDILIVDEVLAVGDAEFQNKCLGKMQDVANQGRTVLLVSHNMHAVAKFCTRCLWLDGGRLRLDGDTADVLDAYMKPALDAVHGGSMDLRDHKQRYGSGEARILSASLLDANGTPTTRVVRTEPFTVEFDFESSSDSPLHFTVQVVSDQGVKVLHASHHDSLGARCVSFEGRHTASVAFPASPLAAGKFNLILAVHTASMQPLDTVTDVLPFESVDTPDSPRPYETVSQHGVVWVPTDWSIA